MIQVQAAGGTGPPVYSEAQVAFARADRITDVREAVSEMGVTVAPLRARLAERAASLRASRPSLRLPDAVAVAVATAVELGEAAAAHSITGAAWCRHMSAS